MTDPATILVVEDDEDLRRFLEILLESEGFRVITAASAEEALRVIDTSAVDVMITDLVLARMGGLELAWRVLERDLDIGIVLVSGYADRAAVLDALPPRSVSFVAKPFEVREVVAVVREQL